MGGALAADNDDEDEPSSDDELEEDGGLEEDEELEELEDAASHFFVAALYTRCQVVGFAGSQPGLMLMFLN